MKRFFTHCLNFILTMRKKQIFLVIFMFFLAGEKLFSFLLSYTLWQHIFNVTKTKVVAIATAVAFSCNSFVDLIIYILHKFIKIWLQQTALHFQKVGSVKKSSEKMVYHREKSTYFIIGAVLSIHGNNYSCLLAMFAFWCFCNIKCAYLCSFNYNIPP